MNAVVVSHKACWVDHRDNLVVTDGGFPSQVNALTRLFGSLHLVATAGRRLPPAGIGPLAVEVDVTLLPEPPSTGLARKLSLPFWLLRFGGRLVSAVRSADIVHALVPGDLGVLGALLARLFGRRLVVRHCGTWGHRGTVADRFLAWWLPRLARGGAIVFATGGDERPPQPERPNLHWIFSTSLTQADLDRIEPAAVWVPGEPLRLVSVGRLTAGKNHAAAIAALATLRQTYPTATLEILGDGPARPDLAALAHGLGLDGAVTLRGNVDRGEVLATLRRSHIFVFPTRVAEGFPKALLEALACGVPVLAPAVSVIPRLVAEGGGRLLTGTDAAAITSGIVGLLAVPERLAAIGAAGRRTASRYTLERWRDEIGAVLEAAWGPLRARP